MITFILFFLYSVDLFHFAFRFFSSLSPILNCVLIKILFHCVFNRSTDSIAQICLIVAAPLERLASQCFNSLIAVVNTKVFKKIYEKLLS